MEILLDYFKLGQWYLKVNDPCEFQHILLHPQSLSSILEQEEPVMTVRLVESALNQLWSQFQHWYFLVINGIPDPKLRGVGTD